MPYCALVGSFEDILASQTARLQTAILLLPLVALVAPTKPRPLARALTLFQLTYRAYLPTNVKTYTISSLDPLPPPTTIHTYITQPFEQSLHSYRLFSSTMRCGSRLSFANILRYRSSLL